MAAQTAVWRDQLTAAERAELGRGAGTVAHPRPDILVVGGGIAGVATAAACQQAGLGSVLLIESGRLGAGATGGAAGLLTPEIHEWSDPEPFVDLARTSLERWGELERSWPGGVGLVELDWLGLAPDPDGLAPHQRPVVEWLDSHQVAKLVPGLARPMAGALIRAQARVNPLRSLVRLASVIPHISTGTPAVSVTIRAGRIVSVATTAGQVSPGAVVFATGMPPVLDGLAFDLPASQVKGHLLATEPAAIRLPGTVAPVATQLEDGRLLVGGTFDVGDETPRLRAEVIEGILDGLYAALPPLRGLRAAYEWFCFRPRHPDGRPVIDRVPGLDNAWLTSGHFRTGILMAPITAEILTRWIADGQPPREAAAWSAGRFTDHRAGDH
jgi:glycine oxidase